MAAFMLPKMWDGIAKILAGVGAANVGASLLNFDVLSFIPTGMFTTGTLAVIGLSGVYVIQLALYKKI